MKENVYLDFSRKKSRFTRLLGFGGYYIKYEVPSPHSLISCSLQRGYMIIAHIAFEPSSKNQNTQKGTRYDK